MLAPGLTHTPPVASPCSDGFRWRLNRGSGIDGRLSGTNMLAGAGMMAALVTGPVREKKMEAVDQIIL